MTIIFLHHKFALDLTLITSLLSLLKPITSYLSHCTGMPQSDHRPIYQSAMDLEGGELATWNITLHKRSRVPKALRLDLKASNGNVNQLQQETQTTHSVN